MINKYVSAFVIALACFISAVLSCSNLETEFVNHTAKIINVEPANAAVKHQTGGSVKIISGCVFFVRNMTLIPSGHGVYWWGIPVANNTDPYPRVVMAPLGSYNGQGIYFTLDPQYAFHDISIMEMRSEGDNRAYGAWSISGDVATHYSINTNDENVLDFESGFHRTKPGIGVLLASILVILGMMHA